MIMNKLDRLKLIQAFESIRNNIKDKMSPEEINEEITELRKQRKKR